VDHNTQTIIYALDAIECSVKANLKLVTALKALVAPPVYVCNLEPSDLNRRPGKVFTFEPPAKG
jgi:hypothetical protein